MNTWFLLALLPLCAYRVTRLVVRDDLPPVLWVRDRLAGGWRPPTTKEQHHDGYPTGQIGIGTYHNVPGLGMFMNDGGDLKIYARRWKHSPYWLGDLVSCPWCASFWVSMWGTLLYAAVGWIPWSVTLPVGVATWALASILASRESL